MAFGVAGRILAVFAWESWPTPSVLYLPLGTDSAVWCYDGTKWTSLGGVCIGGLTAVSSVLKVPAEEGDRILHVFAIGEDMATWHTSWFPVGSGSWSKWEGLDSTPIRGSAAVASAPGRLDTFAIGTDSAIHWRSGPDIGKPSEWIDETLQPGGVAIGSLAAVATGRNEIDIFALGPDHAVFEFVAQDVRK
ncbi:MAG: hypothetical protein DLM68_08305 [Hyphomicrobiales bacterium]|nr:MAG: hypothetical protein DLM68_08305 [Hyphomicrobiales bacterium]